MAPLRTLSKTMVGGPTSIEVLRRQEMLTYYQCHDYLNSSNNQSCPTEDASVSSKCDTVSVATRTEMLEWVIKACSFLKFQEDIPVMTATLLDRFLQTQQGAKVLTSVLQFRLATMTCFYITAKLHPSFISSEVMSAFSHGLFAPEEIEDLELLILKAMDWHANPPTAIAFVREFLLLLPSSVSVDMKENAYELSFSQIQRSMLDYETFALTEASTIAFFAVQNSLQSLGMDSILLVHVADIFSYATHTDYLDQQSEEQRNLLQASLQQEDIFPTAHKKSLRKRLGNANHKKDGRSLSSSSSSTRSSKKLLRGRTASMDISPCGVADRNF